MAWNQPGGSNNNNPWGRRPNQDGGLDQAMKDWQRKLESILRPGGGGGSGTGGTEGGVGNNGSFLLIVVGALIALWLATGFYQVNAPERGVIQRFGKYVSTRGEGLGWHVPWPIETVTKVNVSEVNSTEYKSRVLTADVNLVDMRLTVQYQYSDPVKMLFAVRDPESTLREVSESAVRESVGRSDLEGVIGAKRQQITDATRELIQKTLDFYGTGIRVTSVNLTDVQVPEPVVPSQRDANKAIADRDRLVKEAEAYQSGIIPVAEGAASKQREDAEAYKSQVTAIAEGEASRFSQLSAAYNASPAVTRERLYLETVESVMKSSKKIVIDSKAGGNMLYLPLDKILERNGSRDADAAAAARAAAQQGEPETITVDGRQRGER